MAPYTEFIGLMPKGSPRPGTKNPDLTMSVGHVGLRVTVLVTTSKDAEGTFSLQRENGPSYETFQRIGRRYTFVAPRAGVWRLIVQFTGLNGWSTQSATRFIKIE
jgi:hypothetical protein